MKKLFLALIFFCSFFAIANTTYASNADCSFRGGVCVARGTCTAEGGSINNTITCTNSLHVCCFVGGQPGDNIGAACQGWTGRWGTCVQNLTCASPNALVVPPRGDCFGSECCIPPSGGGGGWGTCSTPQGNGVCQDMNTTPCNGLDIANYCPGPVNIRCCVSRPPTPTPTPIPRYTISGTVFVDTNRNGNRDSGESGYGGITVSGAGSATTDGNGNYTLSNILGGTYTLSIPVPANHVPTNPNPASQAVTVGPNRTGINFGIVPVYSISGSVFNDIDKDYVRDAGEGKTWSGTVSFTRNPANGSISTNSSAGTFSATGLFAGTYTVSLTSGIPTGFLNQHPVNGPPPAFSVTVGSGCTFSPQHPNAAGRATCNTRGDVSNLNFVITNSIPWFQTYGFDVRIDNGITNLIPATPTYPGFMSVIDTLN